ncbi:hypothetical protein GQ55_8G187900 [Panicum hallii var. hallii]|uniref:Uncharacterized protein n=1 Tax=Panicum hallii var. hallii TaxID=1504633 RepID=A0A2T7CNW6_9POAL|nr:hypothetical protein GQ55_8G187900 [Panicum hallii var. hallii]
MTSATRHGRVPAMDRRRNGRSRRSSWLRPVLRFVESQVDYYWSQLLLQGQEMALVTEAPEPPRSGPSRAAVEPALRLLLSFVDKE